MQSATHESFSREHTAKASSDRSFGLVFTAFFTLVAIWPLVHKRPLRPWGFWIAGAFLLIALIAPKVLHPLNLVWTRFGLLLSKITNPIVTGLMFYLIFTPAGFLLRMFGKDILRLKYDASAPTYWIVRNPAGPAPESMRNQF
jgi:hypothetical protein